MNFLRASGAVGSECLYDLRDSQGVDIVGQIDDCGLMIYGGERPKAPLDVPGILDEAKAQTVYTSVFPLLEVELMRDYPQKYGVFQEDYFRNLILNTNNLQEHRELHKLMTARGISYVAIKGLSSVYFTSTCRCAIWGAWLMGHTLVTA